MYYAYKRMKYTFFFFLNSLMVLTSRHAQHLRSFSFLDGTGSDDGFRVLFAIYERACALLLYAPIKKKKKEKSPRRNTYTPLRLHSVKHVVFTNNYQMNKNTIMLFFGLLFSFKRFRVFFFLREIIVSFNAWL